MGMAQRGGCAVVARDEITQYVKSSSNDFRNIGRWTSMVLSSHPNQRLRIVVAYNVGKSKPQGLRTFYQQTLSAMQKERLPGTPRNLMRNDFIDQIKTWLRQGDRILLSMDANENVIDGPLCSKLADLGFTPWGHKLHGSLPNTHAAGTECIDEVWGSYGLECTAVKILSYHRCLGDHRMFLVDFTTRSAIGLYAHLIVRPQCRRLVTSNKECTERYLALVEEQWKYHRINERLQKLQRMPHSSNSRLIAERLDRQMTEIMLFGEKHCRRIRKIDGEYSLSLKYWHEKAVSIKALLRRLDHKTSNDGNICRTARRHEIHHPRRLNKQQLRQMYRIAIARKKTLKQQARFLRNQYLRERRALAVARNDPTKANAITKIMKREHDAIMWKRINRVVRDPHPGALMRVQREIDGTVLEFTEEDALIDNIMDVIQDRFSGAEDAPISNCSLTDALGEFGFTELGLKIISGDFEPPADLHQATRRLLQLIGDIGRAHRHNIIDTVVTPDDFSTTWRTKAREKTSSSMSRRHFGHYRACAQSPTLSRGLAMHITYIAKSGVPPDRWFNVLMVMLEKQLGVILIPKLRAILLKEADNNFHDGVMFGGRMLPHARNIGLIPEEQIADKEKTAEDGVFAKVLKADYSRLMRQPFAEISADAANCYDLVNHLILALLLRAIGTPPGPILAMLTTIKGMKYFLRTGFGESKTYMGGDRARRRMHGLNQGSTAASQNWLLVSSVLVKMQRARGHIAQVVTPISNPISSIVGNLYVDDTVLFVLNDHLDTKEALHSSTQASISDWGDGLIASGGSCKPAKCWAYMLNYDWDETGQWFCESMVDDYPITVPTHCGPENIEILHADTCKETLGVFTCPAGLSTDHFTKIATKMKTWISRIQAGHLPVSFNWTSYVFQLWTSIRYGIGALPADRSEIGNFLEEHEQSILPLLGVNRNIRTGWRTLHRSFLGIGLFNFNIELMIQRINLFLQHFDSPYDTGVTLRATLELLQLEAGYNDCILLHSFHPIGVYTTHCWTRSLWQALDHFNLRLHLHYPSIPIPRERDHVLLNLYQASNWDPSHALYVSWNRCRIANKALFLSDITTPDGKQIDIRYLDGSATSDPPLSEYNFPREQPCEADWQIWRDFWSAQTYPGFVLATHLGPWIHHSHRIHEWYYCQRADCLFQRKAGGGYYYGRTPSTLRSSRRSQKFNRLGPAPSIPDLSTFLPCAVTKTSVDTVILGAPGPMQYEPSPVTHDLLSLLQSWGGSWMWENFVVVGKLDAVITSIHKGSALWCTDGSYDRLIMPEVSSAGWIIFDPITRNYIHGSFYETSGVTAGSYRGELLGLCALHLLAAAITELYGKPSAKNKLFCDNERALARTQGTYRRVSSGTKHGDIMRLLRCIKFTIPQFFDYHHIYGHADDRTSRKNLTLVQQLNCHCDDLAKDARRRSIHTFRDVLTQTLPRESVALFLNTAKQTGDISDPLRWHLARTEAKRFYVTELKWSAEQFDAVDWYSIDITLRKKKQMYSLWLAKQCSKFCGTRLQVARMSDGGDDRCPNCLEPEERSTHLNLCFSINRTRQFIESVSEFSTWLNKEHTHPEIAFWVPRYLLGRNRVLFSDLPTLSPRYLHLSMSSQMKAVASSQDKIGWINFLEGKVTGHFRGMQQLYLRSRPSRLNGDDWTKQFISRLLKISHTQWIFRNFTLHDKQHGHLSQLRRDELYLQMEKLQNMDPDEIPECSKFLLDFDIDDLAEGDISTQEHWIHAVKAARHAGRRTRRLSVHWGKLPRRRKRDPSLRPVKPPFQPRIPMDSLQHDVFSDLTHPPKRCRPSEAVLSLLEPSNKRKKRRKTASPPPLI